jgi:hypothetical protein
MDQHREFKSKFDEDKNKRMFSYLHNNYFTVNGNVYVVPSKLNGKDFWFDGATVPRIFWWAFPPTGKAFEAASLHDIFYMSGFINQMTKQKVTRKFADELFLYHMLQDKVPHLQAYLFYIMVRAFGGIKYWLDNRKKKNK